MYDLMVVKEVLMKSLEDDSNAEVVQDNPAKGQDCIISQLIHDIFGGEILKTRMKRGWHFYNRVEGLRIDFTRFGMGWKKSINRFEDIPVTPEETKSYFAIEDYSVFFMRFVKAFEEKVGLKKYHMA